MFALASVNDIINTDILGFMPFLKIALNAQIKEMFECRVQDISTTKQTATS